MTGIGLLGTPWGRLGGSGAIKGDQGRSRAIKGAIIGWRRDVDGVREMIDFTSNGRRFNYRVAGVAIHDEHVLLHCMDDTPYWILPGGRVEFGETSCDALQREMQEELGQTIQVGRLLWIVESFLVDARQRVHGIGLYYAMDLDPSAATHTPFEVIDGGARLLFAWHPLARLDALVVYPPFLRQHLLSLPEHTMHILDVRAQTLS